MYSFLAWPLLAVWMGLALVVFAGLVGVFVYSLVHMLWDSRGVEHDLWCPVWRRRMHVRAVPTHFAIAGVPGISDLHRCERYGDCRIRCGKWCLQGRSLSGAATAN